MDFDSHLLCVFIYPRDELERFLYTSLIEPHAPKKENVVEFRLYQKEIEPFFDELVRRVLNLRETYDRKLLPEDDFIYFYEVAIIEFAQGVNQRALKIIESQKP